MQSLLQIVLIAQRIEAGVCVWGVGGIKGLFLLINNPLHLRYIPCGCVS